MSESLLCPLPLIIGWRKQGHKINKTFGSIVVVIEWCFPQFQWSKWWYGACHFLQRLGRAKMSMQFSLKLVSKLNFNVPTLRPSRLVFKFVVLVCRKIHHCCWSSFCLSWKTHLFCPLTVVSGIVSEQLRPVFKPGCSILFLCRAFRMHHLDWVFLVVPINQQTSAWYILHWLLPQVKEWTCIPHQHPLLNCG